ncbi:hypothetical protein SO802_022203 [Lithocarpus litseifolius]|uniref:Aminotransferase-like plant mobile domain-containing protein n=1 Tax=Lithocarpus litseifolius TaxID=425828 RepID=A0AAW2CJE3_9ROSI
MELLGHFGIAPRQLMPNSWRIVISCIGIWLAATDGDMIKVDELVYLYCLKASKEHGYYKLVPWERRTRIVPDLPSSFRSWKSRFFFVSRDDWETSSNEVWGDLPRLLRWWRTLNLVERRPKLKNKYKECVEKTIEYARTIEDFDDLVDTQTLAFHFLGPDPSAFVFRNIEIEEKKKRMTTKLNQSMYAKMRGKKKEPLSSIGKKTVRLVGKGISGTPPAPVTEPSWMASLATSVEEITPIRKRPRVKKIKTSHC